MDEELLQRQAPQALEAEQSVLGSMLIDERCVPDVVGMLQPDDFYLRQNREIYETIYTMFNFSEKIDPVTVLNKMKERGVYDEQRSYDYIAQLLKITPTAANVKQYCTIVMTSRSCVRWRLRRLRSRKWSTTASARRRKCSRFRRKRSIRSGAATLVTACSTSARS